MLTQSEFLEQLWRRLVRRDNAPNVLRRIARGKGLTDDRAEVLRNMFEKGVAPEEIAALLEEDRKQTLFELMVLVEKHGLEPDAWDGIHEEFLVADPDVDRGSRSEEDSALELYLESAFSTAFSPDSARVACAGDGRIHEVRSGKVVARCAIPAHCTEVAWSPDGRWLAFLNTTGVIRVCSARTGQVAGEVWMRSEGRTVGFTERGELYGASWAGSFFVWKVPKGEPVARFSQPELMLQGAWPVPDGWAVFALRRGSPTREPGQPFVAVLDPSLERELSRVRVDEFLAPNEHAAPGEVAVKSYGGKISVRRVEDGSVLRSSNARQQGAPMAWSPDGSLLVLGHEGEFKVLDAKRFTVLASRRLGDAHHAAFSPDGRWLALSTMEGGGVWRVEALLGR